ncbi:MAG TPA: hypothetical protein VG843_10620 [Rhizomicrobium sp.]|nr:hypothetical protein [Rhizomicrobium sp.]
MNEDALDGVGSRPSPFFVERVVAEAAFEATRHFTPDLNSGGFVYDWPHRNDGRGGQGDDTALRRFWRFQRTGSAA